MAVSGRRRARARPTWPAGLQPGPVTTLPSAIASSRPPWTNSPTVLIASLAFGITSSIIPSSARSRRRPARRRRAPCSRNSTLPSAPRRGEIISPMIAAPWPSSVPATSWSTRAPHLGIGDHPAVPRRLLASGLELGLHQPHQVAAGADQAEQGRGDGAQGDERAGRRPPHRPAGPGRRGVRWRTLVRSRTSTRGSVSSRWWSWPRPTSTAMTRCGAGLEGAVGEAARGGTGVEHELPGQVQLEAVEGGGELLAAPTDEARRWTGHDDGLVGGDQARRLGGRSTGHQDIPRSIASRARSLLGIRPRRTSSASSLRRVAVGASAG